MFFFFLIKHNHPNVEYGERHSGTKSKSAVQFCVVRPIVAFVFLSFELNSTGPGRTFRALCRHVFFFFIIRFACLFYRKTKTLVGGLCGGENGAERLPLPSHAKRGDNGNAGVDGRGGVVGFTGRFTAVVVRKIQKFILRQSLTHR